MKNYKNGIFYISTILIFSLLIYFIIDHAPQIESGRNIVLPSQETNLWQDFFTSLKNNLKYPLSVLLLQVVTIILVARIFGMVFRKIGQPAVMGEIVAGIFLGPSFVGMFFPGFSEVLFPAASLTNLQLVSQIGLILFMFVVGMELDLGVLKSKAQNAVVISHASIIIPFSLGMGLSFFIYEDFAPEGVRFVSFALFMGIAMSITAFPVLARILQERNMLGSKLGSLVITCAAADDVTAWCILAIVIAIVKAGSFWSAIYFILLSVVYVIVMIKVVRPFLEKVAARQADAENISKPIVIMFFLTLVISAYVTEAIGIHALFGAFMAGAVMPENKVFRKLFIEKVEDIALVLLLPLFFVFTGLRTQIGLLNDISLLGVTLIIIALAVLGKFAGSAFAARFVGQSWKDSIAIGALMNTRGLMELVVLNIGYDLGVLSPEIFTMMVIMALATTMMTGPVLNFLNKISKSNIY